MYIKGQRKGRDAEWMDREVRAEQTKQGVFLAKIIGVQTKPARPLASPQARDQRNNQIVNELPEPLTPFTGRLDHAVQT